MKKGISLVVLIITIIVIIILSATVILALTKNNPISSAKEATFKSDVRNMQDDLSMYVSKLYADNLMSQTEKIDADKYTTDGESDSIYTYISSFSSKYNNKFIIMDNQLVYCGKEDFEKEVAKSLNVSIFEKDEYAGDLSKNGTCDGTEEKPYKINCIEDLIFWSNNAGKYTSSYITLERNLDFNSKFSYNNYKTIIFGDINKDGKVDSLMTELTSGSGFKPISAFTGNFDGKNNEIQNIYINSTSGSGLFLNASKSKISNFGITGNIITTSSNAGGIAASGAGVFTNCYNKCNVKSSNYTGGIVGYPGTNADFTINNCYNTGSIESTDEDITNAYSGFVGGIAGYCHGDGCRPKIYNCYNLGKVSGKNSGGIIGKLHGYGNLINCYNMGIVSGINPGGIISQTYSSATIANCYNTGSIIPTSTNVGASGFNYAIIFASKYPATLYYQQDGDLKFCLSGATEYKNIKASTKEYMQSQEFVNSLNKYVEEYQVQEDGISLNTWKYSDGNSPSFNK